VYQSRTRAATLADLAFPRAGVLRDALLVVGGSVFMALSAQISVPLYGGELAHPVARAIASLYGALGVPLPTTPVPISGQTLAVLLVGALLGSRLGTLSVLAYLGEGLAGLPVFALGTSAWSPSRIPGVPVILGPTAGYLVGFVVAAFLVGWLAERGWDRRPLSTALAMVIGNLAIYLVGVAWLLRFVPSGSVLMAGVVPFIPGDLLKIAIAAAVLPSGWALLRSERGR